MVGFDLYRFSTTSRGGGVVSGFFKNVYDVEVYAGFRFHLAIKALVGQIIVHVDRVLSASPNLFLKDLPPESRSTVSLHVTTVSSYVKYPCRNCRQRPD